MRKLRGNNNLNRAQSIISAIGKDPDEKPALPPVDGIPVVDENTPPVVDENIPPVIDENIPPVVDENVPPVIDENVPPVVDENTPPVIEPEIPPVLAEVSDEVILSKLSETLGRKIESYDDLKPKEIAVDPELKQLIEWKEKTGLSLTQFADYTKDFSEMSDMAVAREILSQKYPTFTKEQLDFKLNSFVYDEDVDEHSDKMRKSIALTELATDGRAMLEQNKLDLVGSTVGLTTEQQEAIAYANDVKTQTAQSVTSQQAYENNLNLAAQNLDTLSLNLEEGVVIEHKIDDGIKNGLKDYVLNVPHWYNEDGTPNPTNIAKDGYKIQNFDQLMKIAFEQGKAVQKDNDIKGKGNIQLDAQGKPQGQEEAKKGNISSVIDNLTGSNPNKFRFRKNKN